jgi:hypothetical protein
VEVLYAEFFPCQPKGPPQVFGVRLQPFYVPDGALHNSIAKLAEMVEIEEGEMVVEESSDIQRRRWRNRSGKYEDQVHLDGKWIPTREWVASIRTDDLNEPSGD